MGGKSFQGPRLNGFLLKPEDLMIVGIDVKDVDENNELHFLYDDRINLPLKEEFVLNIMALGVKKNIIVVRIGDMAYVVDGRQRVRAAREANRRLKRMGEPEMRVPVVQQTGEEPLIMTVAISTNEFNVADTLLAKARKAQRLRDRGLSVAEIATAFGVTTKAVQNWEKILHLTLPVKQAIADGRVSASAAAQLYDLSSAEQQVQLDRLLSANNGRPPTINEVKVAKIKAKGVPSSHLPSRKVLRYIVEKHREHTLSSDFVDGVAFAIGLKDSSAINGLSAVLAAARAMPVKKKKPKTQPTS